ncbi:hypothetical protein [Pelagibacterium halotolerans]|uniref:hypothetical protein n=1 Tax=Pelagibacterium halotolerans TaxID=531813 RepID=UPI00059F437E|nr:hypothetical protein [Pelagibacterium halotolerans]QJR17596.1 hypothetical protein HKM20_03565 [Pelagibacterium halotolerans]SEA84692.1 hypothetical protein SAMN05428936_10996 [Pelagibacterium halotolerans]
MSKTGWEFIAPLRRRGTEIIRACVRIDDEFAEIAVPNLQTALEQMRFFDEPDDEWAEHPGPTPDGHIFDFAIWDADGFVWWPDSYDGLARLRRTPGAVEAWMREQEQER